MLSLQRRQSTPRKKREVAEVMCYQSTEDRSQSSLEDAKIIKESLSAASHTPPSNFFSGSQRKVSKVRVLWQHLKQAAREWSVFL